MSYLNAGAAVTVDVAAGTGSGDASVGNDTFSWISSVRGSNHDDFIYGSNSGFEQFEGRGGSDLIDGRGGLDRARYEFESSAVQVNLAAGTVTGGDSGGGQDTLQSIEFVRGTNFNDTYDATGFGPGSTNAGSAGTFNEFEGMGGNDTITGNGNTQIVFYNATGGVTVDLAAGTVAGDASVGNDTITGGVTAIIGSQFGDTLQGFANAFGVGNVFDGRGGNDTYDGRGGYDQAVYNADGAITTGISVDMAAGTVTGDAAVGTDTLISVESVRGTNFADTYDATGYTGASADLPLGADFSEFEGMGGDDVITGNGNTRISYLNAGAGVTVDLAAGTASGAATGNDTFTDVSRVRGSNLDDAIFGDGNNNTIEGRNGNDIIEGRGGNDTLTGGFHADTFVFASGDGADTITDFNQGESDLIDLSGTGTTAFGQLAISQNGADTLIDLGSGDSITLSNFTAGNLSAADFVLDTAAPTVTLTVNTSNGYDMHGINGDIGFADGHAPGATHSATHYDMINAGTGHTIHLVGTDFTYDGSENLTGGTITGIDIQATSNGFALVTMTGFAIDAVAFINAAAAVQVGDFSQLSGIFHQYAFNATGGAGNDTIRAYANADTIDGGGGANTVDYVSSASGLTVNLADPGQNTGIATGDSYTNITGIIGSNFNDTLIGDAGPVNALEGGAGGDALIGGGGALDYASYLHAQSGVIANLADPGQNTGDAAGDTYSGINGVLGTNFNDTLVGDAGDDLLRGRGGADVIDGGAGSDTADYNFGPGVRADLSDSSTNTGQAFGDSYVSIENLRGSSFGDTLKGDAGDNMLTGQGGADIFIYSGGADTIADFSQGQNDRIDLKGSGTANFGQLAISQVGADTVIDFGAGDSITLSNFTAANLTQNDFFFDVPTVTLTVLAANGYDLHGLNGDIGFAVVDTGTADATHYDAVNAGSGHTFRFIGSGFTYDGSGPTAGTVSTIQIRNTSTSGLLVTMAGFAIDAVALNAAAAAAQVGNFGQLSGIFNQYAYDATGGAGNDVIRGYANRDTFDGGGGINTVDYVATNSGVTVNLADPSQNTGNAAGDTYANITGIIGTNFNDTLIGDGNINALEGGAGADTLIGGGGSFDFASYIHAQSAVTVNLANPGQNTGDAAGDSYSGIANVLGSNFNDTLTGDAGDNFLRGRIGADVLDGGDGSDTADYANGGPVRADLTDPGTNAGEATGDTYISIENLRGSNFNDGLVGDADANVLTGQGGNDFLEGMNGDDTLIGGDGDDNLTAGFGNDWLTGNAGADTFVFWAGSGYDAITDFAPGVDVMEFWAAAFATSGDALAATEDDGFGNTYVQIDVDNWVFLEGVVKSQLTVGDFQIV